MAKINSYKDLEVWKRSVALVTEVYKMTAVFPSSELYGLISQVRRAAVSIPANIAEGWGRENTKAYIQYLRIAKGSLYELTTMFEIAVNLEYINEEKYKKVDKECDELSRMLNAMIVKLTARIEN